GERSIFSPPLSAARCARASDASMAALVLVSSPLGSRVAPVGTGVFAGWLSGTSLFAPAGAAGAAGAGVAGAPGGGAGWLARNVAAVKRAVSTISLLRTLGSTIA